MLSKDLALVLRFWGILQKKLPTANAISAHARNFPFIFNIKFHACTKIDVEIFARFPKTSVKPWPGLCAMVEWYVVMNI